MKKLFFITLFGLAGFMPLRSTAQVAVNINIGAQPLWGPVGYDHVDYYYLPDVESYYYVPKKQYIYSNRGAWVFAAALPVKYNGYNFYNGYKVVINSPKPYLQFNNHKVKYAKYRSNGSQLVILKSNNPKYYVVKGHPKNAFKGNAKYHLSKPGKKGNGKSKGNGKH